MADPVSLSQIKRHLRVDGNDEDEEIRGFLSAAVAHVEDFTGVFLSEREVTEVLDSFDAHVRAWPISSFVSVGYVDPAGADQLLPAAVWAPQMRARPGRLSAIGSWPSTARRSYPITITMIAGYSSPELVPPSIVQAIKLLVGHFYRNREAVVVGVTPAELPLAVASLLRAHRYRTL